MQRVGEGNDVSGIGQSTVAGPILLYCFREALQQLRRCPAAALIDRGEQFVEADPIAISQPDCFDPPVGGGIRALKLKRERDCGFSDRFRVGLRNNPPHFDRVGNQVGLADGGDFLSSFVVREAL